MFSSIWQRSKNLQLTKFSLKLFGQYNFQFYLNDVWPLTPIKAALALNLSDHTEQGWEIFCLSRKDCEIEDYLKKYARDIHGKLTLEDDGQVIAFYDFTHEILRVYDFRQKCAAIICRDDYQFSEWELHSPFKEFWHIWALKNNALLIHSGVICAENKAILLPGAGGSGKSTTVISALEAGLSTTGDDYNLLMQKAGDYVLCPLYCNLKIKLPTQFHFNILDKWQFVNLTYAKKRIYYPEISSAIWQRKFPKLVSLLSLKIGHDRAQIREIRKIEMLNKLAISSALQTPYMAQEYLAKATELINHLQIASLNLEVDYQANIAAIRNWLKEK